MDAVVAGWADDQCLAPHSGHLLRPRWLRPSRFGELGALGDLVYLHLGSLFAQFALAGAEAGEEFAAVASAGDWGGSAVVEDLCRS